MIAPAFLYKEVLQNKYSKAISLSENKYLMFSTYTNFYINIEDNSRQALQYVCLSKNEVVGYLEAKINQEHLLIDEMVIVNLSNTSSMSIGKDLIRFLDLLFVERGYRKIYFRAITQNPINDYYNRFITKISKAGEFIGVLKDYVKLSDNNYYDIAVYYLDRDRYVEWYETRPIKL